MSITNTQRAGHEAVQVDAGAVRLVATTSVGPRVLALLTEDGANAFVEVPDMTLPCPGSGPIHLRGGHRLWAAPEDPRTTYRPDDDPVGVEEIPGGVRLVTRPDPVAGTSREMSIVATGLDRFTFEYRVVNTADRPQRLAAWAITMMAPLGRAWLPFSKPPTVYPASFCWGPWPCCGAGGRSSTPRRSACCWQPSPWPPARNWPVRFLPGRQVRPVWWGNCSKSFRFS